MNCRYCSEPIEPIDEKDPYDPESPYHRECKIRIFAGTTAHQLGECICYGGARYDPPGLSLRDAARLACDTFDALHAGDGDRAAVVNA